MPKKSKNILYYESVGRRKKSVARVRLYIVGKSKSITVTAIKGKAGDIYVNKKPIDKIFISPQEKVKYLFPLKLTNSEERFVVSILVRGGGKTGQLEAIIHGLARALDKVNREEYHQILKKHGLLTRDPRAKERRKVGTGGKARRSKQSPKR